MAENDDVQLFIPIEPITISKATSNGQQDQALSLQEQLLKSENKTIGYFDDVVKLYIITKNYKSCNGIDLDLIYSSSKIKSFKLNDPIYSDDSLSVWEFETMITPDRYSNEIKFKVYYNKVVHKEEEYLEDFKLTGSVTIGDSNLTKIRKQEKLISCSKSLRISPIFQMKFRTIKSEKILTSLELNLSNLLKELNYKVVINSISIQIKNCDIVEYSNFQYPLTLKPNSTFNVTYKLTNNDGKAVKPIMVVINSTINEINNVSTKWITNIHFQQTTPATLGGVPHPTVLSGTPSPNPNAFNKMRSTTSAISLPKRSVSRLRSTSSTNLATPKRNLSISISGQTKVKLGEVFRWKLQLINKSNDYMNLILYIQSSIDKQYEKSVPLIPIQHPNSNTHDPIPLYSLNQLIKSCYNKFNKIGLISLSNNIKINLEPGQLFETELELIGIEKGFVNLQDFKVLEIHSGEVFECGRLLDVLVV